MEERRSAHVGTVSGLALLAGSTAVAAVAGGAHSIFATILLGMLAMGMGHALLDEIRRQGRRSTPVWAWLDTVNAVLLGAWAFGALIASVLVTGPPAVRVVGLALSVTYALSCAHLVVTRCRTIALIGSAGPRPPGSVPGGIAAGSGTTAPSAPADTDVRPGGQGISRR